MHHSRLRAKKKKINKDWRFVFILRVQLSVGRLGEHPSIVCGHQMRPQKPKQSVIDLDPFAQFQSQAHTQTPASRTHTTTNQLMCYVPMIVMIDFAWKLRSVLLCACAPLFHLAFRLIFSIFLSYLWWIDCVAVVACSFNALRFFVCKNLCIRFFPFDLLLFHLIHSFRFVLVSAALPCKPFLNVDFHCYYLFPKLTLNACFKITNPNDVQR